MALSGWAGVCSSAGVQHSLVTTPLLYGAGAGGDMPGRGRKCRGLSFPGRAAAGAGRRRMQLEQPRGWDGGADQGCGAADGPHAVPLLGKGLCVRAGEGCEPRGAPACGAPPCLPTAGPLPRSATGVVLPSPCPPGEQVPAPPAPQRLAEGSTSLQLGTPVRWGTGEGTSRSCCSSLSCSRQEGPL